MTKYRFKSCFAECSTMACTYLEFHLLGRLLQFIDGLREFLLFHSITDFARGRFGVVRVAGAGMCLNGMDSIKVCIVF
jgi:hypothetical protein